MARRLEYQGVAEYENEANDFFIEWATIGGKGLDVLLQEMLGDYDRWSGRTKVRIILEELAE